MWLCVSEARSRLVRQRRSVMRDTVQFGGGAGMVVPLAPSSGEQCSMMLPSMWLCLPVETLVPGYWMWNTGRMCMSHPIFALQHPRINQLSWFRRGQIYERERGRNKNLHFSAPLPHACETNLQVAVVLQAGPICKSLVLQAGPIYKSPLSSRFGWFTNHCCAPDWTCCIHKSIVLQTGPIHKSLQSCRFGLFTNPWCAAGFWTYSQITVVMLVGPVYKSLLCCKFDFFTNHCCHASWTCLQITVVLQVWPLYKSLLSCRFDLFTNWCCTAGFDLLTSLLRCRFWLDDITVMVQVLTCCHHCYGAGFYLLASLLWCRFWPVDITVMMPVLT